MNKKIALITGGTGGIGGACVRYLSKKGWIVYVPVRSMNENAKKLERLPGVIVTIVDQDSVEAVRLYIRSLYEEGVIPTLIILAAGGWGPNREFYDHQFPGATIKEQQRQAIAGHTASSVTTKETVLKSLVWVYSDEEVKTMTLVAIGSHAAAFSNEEALHYEEVGYVEAMRLLEVLIRKFAGFFKHAFVDRAGLVRTTLTKTNLSSVLDDPTREVKESDQYAEELIVKTELI